MTKTLKIGMACLGVIIIAALSCSCFLDEEAAPLPDDARADAIVIEKSAHRMTLYKDRGILRAYQVSLGRGGLNPKGRGGDNLTPEGIYEIDARNPRSAFHLALHVSYPNGDDVRRAKENGSEPGNNIMIHGLRNGLGWLGALHRRLDWTAGCIAVTDKEIEEIWRAVPDHTRVEIRP